MRPDRYDPELPPAAYAAALAGLPGAGPAWLVGVLAQRTPGDAWRAVLAGEAAPPVAPGRGGGGPERPSVAEAARHFDVRRQWDRCRQLGIAVCWPGSPGYPGVLHHGPAPAGVLFVAGKPEHVQDNLHRRRRVAIIGTRRCSPDGPTVAYQLAYDLAQAGVCVVSGLALGIDGAAHAGALAAGRDGPGPTVGGTVGVAASGVDVVYPRQHTALWAEVVRTGAVLSETPPGRPAQAWRFPSRNRLIAGLADMVVVVECHARGGSWHTVEAALRRGVDVGAVPGSVLSPASWGTNRLLHEGAAPIRGADDVLDALEVLRPPARAQGGRPVAAGAALAPLDQAVMAAVSRRPLCLDEVVERSGLPVPVVVASLEHLDGQGAVTGEGGWWVRKRG